VVEVASLPARGVPLSTIGDEVGNKAVAVGSGSLGAIIVGIIGTNASGEATTSVDTGVGVTVGKKLSPPPAVAVGATASVATAATASVANSVATGLPSRVEEGSMTVSDSDVVSAGGSVEVSVGGTTATMSVITV
jgi:hypothetical protein